MEQLKSGRGTGGSTGAAARSGTLGQSYAARARLGEIVLVEAGSRPKGGAAKYDLDVPSIGGEHLTAGGRFDFSRVKYVPEQFYLSMRQGHIRRRDVLLVKDGATIGKVSLVTPAFPFARACVNEHVFILRPKNPDRLRPEYLFYFLRTPGAQARIRQRISGSAQGGLTKRSLASLSIDIPSPGEQARIASILSNVDALIANVEATMASHKKLRLGLAQNLFLKATTASAQKWKMLSLSSIAHIDPLLPRNSRPGSTTNVSFVPMRSIEENTGKISLKLTKKYFEVSSGYTYFRNGDILFAKITPSMENGKVGLARNLVNGIGFATTEVYVIRLKNSNFDPRFYLYYLLRPSLRARARQTMSGTAGQLRVPSSFIKNVRVPAPLEKEQRAIASILSGVDATIENYYAYQQQLERLKKGLMQKLLTGKI